MEMKSLVAAVGNTGQSSHSDTEHSRRWASCPSTSSVPPSHLPGSPLCDATRREAHTGSLPVCHTIVSRLWTQFFTKKDIYSCRFGLLQVCSCGFETVFYYVAQAGLETRVVWNSQISTSSVFWGPGWKASATMPDWSWNIFKIKILESLLRVEDPKPGSAPDPCEME